MKITRLLTSIRGSILLGEYKNNLQITSANLAQMRRDIILRLMTCTAILDYPRGDKYSFGISELT
jgi:hypothetical protein